jgi:hypothetical protein
MDVVSPSVLSSIEQGLKQGDCEEVRQVYGVLSRFVTYRRPGSFLVDTFPILAHIPLFDIFSNWRNIGAEIFRKDSEVFLSFWNQMLNEVKGGTAPHSFGRDFVQSNYQALGLDELLAAYTAYARSMCGDALTSIVVE